MKSWQWGRKKIPAEECPEEFCLEIPPRTSKISALHQENQDIRCARGRKTKAGRCKKESRPEIKKKAETD